MGWDFQIGRVWQKEPEKEKEPGQEVLIVEDSPTVFNGNKLPKTIKSNQFISVVTNAHTLRTKVLKYKKNIDRIITQIKVVEQNCETGSDREDFLDELYAEIQKENKELKEKMKDHEELTSQARTMAGFIERTNADSTQQMAVKAKTDATTALAEADKHEEDLEKIIDEWSTANLKFLAGRKRKKSEPRNPVGQADMRNSESKIWLGSFEKTHAKRKSQGWL